MTAEEPTLDEVLSKVDLSEKTELGEVTKEFSENKPSSSNLTDDEHKLTWRAKGIYSKYPKTLKMINDSEPSYPGDVGLINQDIVTGYADGCIFTFH